MNRLGVAIQILFALNLAAVSTRAAPPSAAVASERVATGLERPVGCDAPAGDSRRLFILEQHLGNVRILDLNTRTLLPTPLLTVGELLKGNEQGLLGLAFHPNFVTNGLFYLYATVPGGGAAGHTAIARYQVDGNPLTTDIADPASKRIVLTFDQPQANHNGGWLGFGPDGFLYVGTGDGGGGDDPHGPLGNGQNRDTLLGKILRLDVDHGEPYAIPEGNPFKGDASKRGEIWAFGIRNAWRCGFDRQTGDLWIGDVGQNRREEIDRIPAGKGGLNFGWRVREGAFQNVSFPDEKTVTPATEPVFDYTHERGNCVVGGYVYRGKAIPGLQGTYVYGDSGSARIWGLTEDGKNDFELTAALNPGDSGQRPIASISSFGEDAAGELYLCDLPHGSVYKIVPAP